MNKPIIFQKGSMISFPDVSEEPRDLAERLVHPSQAIIGGANKIQIDYKLFEAYSYIFASGKPSLLPKALGIRYDVNGHPPLDDTRSDQFFNKFENNSPVGKFLYSKDPVYFLLTGIDQATCAAYYNQGISLLSIESDSDIKNVREMCSRRVPGISLPGNILENSISEILSELDRLTNNYPKNVTTAEQLACDLKASTDPNFLVSKRLLEERDAVYAHRESPYEGTHFRDLEGKWRKAEIRLVEEVITNPSPKP